MKADPYETLGMNKNASIDDVKKAYRRMALEYHPDRNKKEDAHEKFIELQEAYKILSDPKRRKAFDENGDISAEEALLKSAAQGVLIDAFVVSLKNQELNPDLSDMMASTVAHMDNKLDEFKTAIRNLKAGTKRLDKARVRIKRKGQGSNILKKVLANMIIKNNYLIQENQIQLNIYIAAIEMAEDYEYEFDIPKSVIDWGTYVASTTY